MRSRLSTLLIALVVVSLVSLPVAGAITSQDRVAFDSDTVPDAKITAEVTKEAHDLSEMGPTEYEGDSGEITSLDAIVSDERNPVTYESTEVEFSDAGAFPHDSNRSALDSSEWSVGGSSPGSMTVSNTTTAPGVEAVSISTSGLSSGQTATASFDVSLDSDEAKRFVSTFLDVDSLDASSRVEIRLTDSDGDWKEISVEPDASLSKSHVIANATGDGYVLQQQLGEITTTTGSNTDGVFDNIRSVDVRIEEADAGVTITTFNLDKTSPYDLGDREVTTADGETTLQRVTESDGPISVTGLDTLGSTFDTGVVHSATWDMNFSASETTGDSDVRLSFDSVENRAAYSDLATVNYRLSLPSAYDLSYSNAELVVDRSLPDSRYTGAQVATGVGESNFSSVSWTDVTDSYLGDSAPIVLDDTIQPGQEIALQFNVLLTDGERGAMTDSGGAGGFAADDDSGGFLSGVWEWIMGLVALGGGAKLIGGRNGGSGQ